jgi:hypothetical protein
MGQRWIAQGHQAGDAESRSTGDMAQVDDALHEGLACCLDD